MLIKTYHKKYLHQKKRKIEKKDLRKWCLIYERPTHLKPQRPHLTFITVAMYVCIAKKYINKKTEKNI